ncbi:MAG: DUF86 domain-containing protein [Acidobacteria bacterium]|nr:MAG: DUF86 domain-containing protein [Acidobacteriota bacterium]
MRREELYLTDMIEAAEAIEQFISGLDRDSFIDNDVVRSAVLQKLTVIGEAAARLPKKFRGRHPEVEWDDIIAFRNIAVHAYFAVAWPIVWVTASQEVPVLKNQIAKILATEFPT